MTSIHVRTGWAKGLILCLAPLVLAGCGSAGGGASLSDSARLTPTTTAENQLKTARLKGKARVEDVKKTARGNSDNELAAKTAAASSKIIKTAKADTPPMPVRRPYRKIRRKPQKAVIVKKGASRLLDKRQAVVDKRPPAQEKAVAVRMVPEKVIPVQVAPSAMPQGIMDALNEATQIRTKEPEKIAEAENVPEKPQFGQSQFRFSGQQ